MNVFSISWIQAFSNFSCVSYLFNLSSLPASEMICFTASKYSPILSIFSLIGVIGNGAIKTGLLELDWYTEVSYFLIPLFITFILVELLFFKYGVSNIFSII